MSATAITNKPSVPVHVLSKSFSTEGLLRSDGSCTHFPLEFFNNFSIFGIFLYGISINKNCFKKSEDFFLNDAQFLTAQQIFLKN